MNTKQILKTAGLLAAFSVSSIGLISCDGSDSSSDIPSSGNSSAGAPQSILGSTLTTKILDADPNCTVIGAEVVYTFVNANVVNGVGGHNLNTTSWSYNANGGVAVVDLNYPGGSSETYELTFQTANSGTYRVVIDRVAEQCNASGTFTIE